MARRPIATLRSSAAALALFAALGVALAIGASGSDGLVQSGFDKALTMREPASTATAPVASVALPQSEEFWLRNGQPRPADVKPVALSGTQLARGDRITISQGASPSRILEVVETAPVALDTTRLDATAEGNMLAVSCRDLSRPDAPFVRLIVSEGVLPFAVTRQGVKAL